MNDLYKDLYNKAKGLVARPIPVANPDPLHNRTVITESGIHDVSSYAEINVDIEEDSDGGGCAGSSITPVITLTCVNDSEGRLYFSTPPYSIDNGNVKEMPYDYEVATNTTATLDLLGIGLIGEDGYIFQCYAMNGDYADAPVASNAVNCTFDENNNRIIVTDPSSNASITMTYHNYQ